MKVAVGGGGGGAVRVGVRDGVAVAAGVSVGVKVGVAVGVADVVGVGLAVDVALGVEVQAMAISVCAAAVWVASSSGEVPQAAMASARGRIKQRRFIGVNPDSAWRRAHR